MQWFAYELQQSMILFIISMRKNSEISFFFMPVPHQIMKSFSKKKIDLETLFSVLCVDVAFGFAHFHWHFYSKTSQDYYNYLPLKTLGKIYFTKRQFPCFVRQAQLNYLFNGSFFVHILNDNNIFPRIFFSRKI